jgi:hypothetical protein
MKEVGGYGLGTACMTILRNPTGGKTPTNIIRYFPNGGSSELVLGAGRGALSAYTEVFPGSTGKLRLTKRTVCTFTVLGLHSESNTHSSPLGRPIPETAREPARLRLGLYRGVSHGTSRRNEWKIAPGRASARARASEQSRQESGAACGPAKRRNLSTTAMTEEPLLGRLTTGGHNSRKVGL